MVLIFQEYPKAVENSRRGIICSVFLYGPDKRSIHDNYMVVVKIMQLLDISNRTVISRRNEKTMSKFNYRIH